MSPNKLINKTISIDNLSPCDVRVLIHSEEELTQTRTFERIFPRPDTSHYLGLMSTDNYYDLLLAAWEDRYGGEDRSEGRRVLQKLAEDKVHLVVPATENKIKMPHKSPVLYKRNLRVPHIFNKK